VACQGFLGLPSRCYIDLLARPGACLQDKLCFRDFFVKEEHLYDDSTSSAKTDRDALCRLLYLIITEIFRKSCPVWHSGVFEPLSTPIYRIVFSTRFVVTKMGLAIGLLWQRNRDLYWVQADLFGMHDRIRYFIHVQWQHYRQ
jgi:hypothetical protein